MGDRDTIADTPPQPPDPPVDGECCQRGCEFCVWVVYYLNFRHSLGSRDSLDIQ